MQMTLDRSEIDALLEALNYYLAELREEIGKTEKYEMREALKSQHALLAGVVARLEGSVADSGAGNLGAQNQSGGS
jgi:hypothetical protein